MKRSPSSRSRGPPSKHRSFRPCRLVELAKLSGPFSLSPDAQRLFENYQRENRALLHVSDAFDEALLSRLASVPVHVLKVAMIFECCRSVKAASNSLKIQDST